eukprot:jgi/Phyca11/132623/e_gw1.193.5.1
MTDFSRVSHLIRNRFLNPNDVSTPNLVQNAPREVHTTARTEKSPFDTALHRGCKVNGLSRCVPLGIFRRFQTLAAKHHIPFPVNRIFLTPSTPQFIIPEIDVRFLTAIIRIPSVGIEGVLEIFRVQTPHDYRPNKALRPRLYRRHLPTYSNLRLLCQISELGVIPHWNGPSARVGIRPVPPNYPSAETGSAIVTHRLVTEYYRGRCILANISALAEIPTFHSSAFALVPKKDVPITDDGRIIHDLSAPSGASINDTTNTDWTPDARWEPSSCIAKRVLQLRRQYPDSTIYALGADIAEAFLHVPVHSRHAPAFGGSFPRSRTGIVSGTAVFGWTASPGYFAVFGKAVRHYQRTGDAVKLVFGSGGWHEGKFTTWSSNIHAVGIDWNIADLTVTIPQRKINKVQRVVAETLDRKFITRAHLNSLVGVLRHVVTFIPIAKPFMQRLIGIQRNIERAKSPGTPMTNTLRLDLEWWQQLVFQNEFAGVPMTMF